ncbi:MAG TPA: Hpt domain-containing protein [Gemmatimonadaceae bacterium]|nr:Hpt domain-containing protein [Gemmatimonadaceae bacterium]
MTAPGSSFLDFFVLEASEYVEQIDGLLQRTSDSSAGPDAEALQRVARALRGSATMAKLKTFADLASTIEAVGRSLRTGRLPWDEALAGALTAAVDDLKLLVRSARAWSPAEDQWATKRIADLTRYIEPATAAPSRSTTAIASPEFFAAEASNIAAGLELLATRPNDKESALNVLRRVRGLRGVAGMREIPALAEVSEAAETAVRPLELGEERLSPERVNLLRVSADLLRAIATGLGTGTNITTSTPQYSSFLSALDAMLADGAGGDRVVPIADLFFNDHGPHVVDAAPNPPTTPAQRFRMEVVSLGEHLHRVIDEARAATDEIQREHARGQLGRALRAIRATAASFGQMAVAQTVEAYLERTGQLNVSALDAIASFATTISPAAIAQTPMHTAAIPQTPPRTTQPRSVVTAASVPEEPARPSAHARVFEAPGKPEPRRSLDNTIAAFESLSEERLAEPAPVAEDKDVVAIDSLLYRGRAALDRAGELRDAIRTSGTPPSQEVVEEILDLVDLARAD